MACGICQGDEIDFKDLITVNEFMLKADLFD